MWAEVSEKDILSIQDPTIPAWLPGLSYKIYFCDTSKLIIQIPINSFYDVIKQHNVLMFQYDQFVIDLFSCCYRFDTDESVTDHFI